MNTTTPTHTTHITPTAARPAARRLHAAAAFSLVEVIFALLLVGIVYVAAINTLGAARSKQLNVYHAVQGHQLAQAHLSTLLAGPYANVGSELKDAIPDHPGWFRQVAVVTVNPDDPDELIGYDAGLRRIRVTVYRGDAPVAELVTLRANAMPTLADHAEAIAP